MKKALFLAVFLSFTLFPTVTSAQTFNPASSEEVNALNTKIIELLTILLGQLQQQLADMIAKQAVTDSAVSSIQSKVDTVVQNTTPQAVYTPPAPQLASVLNLTYICDGSRIKIDVSQNGPYKRGLFYLNSGKGIDGTNYVGGQVWYSKDWPNGFTTYLDQAGDYTVTTSLFNNPLDDKNADNSFLSRTDQINVSQCQ